MVEATRLERAFVNDPTPKVPSSVVVAVSPPERFEPVPHANPRMVDEAVPSEMIVPFKTIDEVETEVGTEVLTDGAAGQTLVVKVASDEVAVPAEFVAKAWT